MNFSDPRLRGWMRQRDRDEPARGSIAVFRLIYYAMPADTAQDSRFPGKSEDTSAGPARRIR
jgi:hypothetical protein